MTGTTANWNRHTVDELGVSFDTNPQWPVEAAALTGGQVVYQQLPGHVGTFFVRYGAAQTLDAFVAGLGGGLTTVDTIADEPATLDGQPARRVTLAVRRRGGGTYHDDAPVRERSPLLVTRLVVVESTARREPFLVGYRLHEDAWTEYQPVLERILAGVTIGQAPRTP